MAALTPFIRPKTLKNEVGFVILKTGCRGSCRHARRDAHCRGGSRPGASVSSRAESLFYTFPYIQRIYCLPLFDAREWFDADSDDFPDRDAHSKRNGRSWDTREKIVPIARVLREVPGVWSFRLERGIWTR